MATTPRLGMFKAADTDYVDVLLDLDAQMDAIDADISTRVVTSGTRPGAPYVGQLVYETNTDQLRLWDGTSWKYISKVQPGFEDITEAAFSAVTSVTIDCTDGGQFAADGSDFKAYKLYVVGQIGTSGDTMVLRFNGDAGANYSYRRGSFTSSTGAYAGTAGVATSVLPIGTWNANTYPQSYEIDIMQRTGVKAAVVVRGWAGTAAEHLQLFAFGNYLTAGFINSITFRSNNNVNNISGRYWLAGLPMSDYDG